MSATSARPLRFLLLAYDRSGSTLLVNYLNSHPDVQCFHEPFNRRIWQDVVRHYGSIPATLQALYDGTRIAENLRVREIAENRSAVARRLLGAAASFRNRLLRSISGNSGGSEDGVAAIGFKVTTTQLFKAVPELWQHICADLPDKVIVLRRSSLIDRFLSCQYALRTGVWHAESPSPQSNAPIHVEFDDFASFVDEERGFDERIEAAGADTRTQWLRLTYEDLVSERDATLQRVFAFLGLEAPERIDGKLAKLASGSAESRIANFAELSKLAAGTPYERHLV